MNSLRFLVLVVSFLATNIYCCCQGINFSQSNNWKSVIAQAKAENKFIFVDGYATWCKPCKMMDDEVYANNFIGRFINDKFISVKLQIDQTDHDQEIVRAWYNEAAFLQRKYKISELPTLLFFSPDGELLYRAIGYHDSHRFRALAEFAIDSNSQEWRPMIEAYRKGKKDYNKMPEVIKQVAEVLKDDSLTKTMIRDYFDNYVNKQISRTKILTRRNVEIAAIKPALLKPNDKVILELSKIKPQHPDSLLHWPGITNSILFDFVLRVELENRLWRNGKVINAKPDWNQLQNELRKKYSTGDIEGVINRYIVWGIDFGHGFYVRTNNPALMNKYIGKEVEKMFQEKSLVYGVNNVCWFTYFLHISDKASLELALQWMDRCCAEGASDFKVDKSDLADLYDTKAALAYKLGRRQDAIEAQEQAVKLSGHNGGKFNTLELIKKGEKIHMNENPVYPADWKLLD